MSPPRSADFDERLVERVGVVVGEQLGDELSSAAHADLVEHRLGCSHAPCAPTEILASAIEAPAVTATPDADVVAVFVAADLMRDAISPSCGSIEDRAPDANAVVPERDAEQTGRRRCCQDTTEIPFEPW
jgi:hypothetical protein